MNHMKRAKAIALAVLLPLSPFAAAKEPAKPEVTNEQVRNAVSSAVTTITRRIETLQTTLNTVRDKVLLLETKVQALETVAAKRGVAVIRAIPGTIRDGDFLPNPALFILGSTIKGFHDTAVWGAELNPVPNRNRQAGSLPEGTYLIELRQPRPPDDDAACASHKPLPAGTNLWSAGAVVVGGVETNPRCHPMRLNRLGTVPTGTNARRLFSGAGVVKVDGTGTIGFQFKIPAAWITTDRPASSYAGSIMITKLE